MKLYEVPRNTLINLDGEKILFHHVDGMYSYCTDGEGKVRHLAAWTDVEIWDENSRRNSGDSENGGE